MPAQIDVLPGKFSEPALQGLMQPENLAGYLVCAAGVIIERDRGLNYRNRNPEKNEQYLVKKRPVEGRKP